jgi:alpha-mannosidase
MSMPSFEETPTEDPSALPPPEPSPEPSEPLPTEGPVVVSLIAYDLVEPPASLADDVAIGSWVAVTAPWHPAVLAKLAQLPRIESVETASSPAAREVRVVAHGQADRLPAAARAQAEEAGVPLIDADTDRPALVEGLLESLGREEPHGSEELDALVADFHALGLAAWFLRDLTAGMNHADCLDHEHFRRESLTAARAWQAGDANGARNRLRAAFEILTQARERFYPVDAYVVDLCLIDPALPGGALTDGLEARAPVTFLGQARAIEAQAERDPAGMAKLRESITEGWADVAGGAYDEVEEPLLPLQSILWQFRRGAAVYRAHLDNRNVETLARRRFGLYPLLPQIGKRSGFRFAVHLGFDAGRFPLRPEAKRLWESPDHTNLEALTRPPLAADRPVQGLRLPWRLAQSMKDDHVATVALLHWPSPVAGWYKDLRRIVSYSPVLARWVTLNDYFHLTDRPFESFSPTPDDYVTPYLSQAIARRDPNPISRIARHTHLRARFDGLRAAHALAEALGASPDAAEAEALTALETTLETGRHDEAAAALDARESFWAGAVAKGIAGSATGGRPGYLVINPTGLTRRAAVILPDCAPDLRPDGPLRAAQFTEDGVVAVVDLPPFGYAWVPRETNYEASPAPVGTLTTKDHTLRNELLAVDFDPASGGLRGIKAIGEDTARLGQQIVIAGLVGPDGQPASTKMRGDTFEIEYGGPALAQAVSTGALLSPDGRKLATFKQRVRLWTGRPLVELTITLADLDPEWLATLASADPWSSYLACRWAWPDSSSMLRRTSFLNPELTEADRPETPDAFDISTRRQRTALLFGGLAHHRRHGPRMLDTLLLAGRESAREFTLGIALDQEQLFVSASDLIAPAFVVATESGPPRTGATSWLFRTDHKSVAITAVSYLDAVEDGRGWGLAFDMIETTGRPARVRLRTFRNPSWARQVDFQGEVIVDLPVDGDAVLVDFTPYEVARIEVTLG